MDNTEYNYLRFVRFSNFVNWSVSHLLGMNIGFAHRFPMATIGSVIERCKTTIDIDDSTQYKQITLKTNGGGAVLRDVKLGKNIGTKKQYVVSAGQFIMSKIDARNGAFGVVTEELDGAIVTADFPVFNVNREKIIPQYLFLLSSTKTFARFAQSCSRGTTNRQRIDISLFLSLRIPLPPLSEQHALVDKFNEKIRNADVFEKKVNQTKKIIESYFLEELGISKSHNSMNMATGHLKYINYKKITKWSIDSINRNDKYNFEKSSYKILRIKDVLTSLDGGKTPNTLVKEYWNGNISWVSAKDMKELFLENIQDKITKTAVEKCGLNIYPENTVLCVFRSGILRHSFPICITKVPATINQDLKALIIDENKVSKLFFVYYLNTLQDLVLNIAQKKGVTVESLNADDFANIPLVTPPHEIQNAIVEHVNEHISEINKLRQQAEYLRKTAMFELENKLFE